MTTAMEDLTLLKVETTFRETHNLVEYVFTPINKTEPPLLYRFTEYVPTNPWMVVPMEDLALVAPEITSQEDKESNTSEVNLTFSAIDFILNHMNDTRGPKPELILQILKIADFTIQGYSTKRPHMLLWDGQQAHYALLWESLSKTYFQEGYRIGSIVRLMGYYSRNLYSGDKVIVVMGMNMVKADAIVIGNPPNAKDIHIPDYSFPTIEDGYEGVVGRRSWRSCLPRFALFFRGGCAGGGARNSKEGVSQI